MELTASRRRITAALVGIAGVAVIGVAAFVLSTGESTAVSAAAASTVTNGSCVNIPPSAGVVERTVRYDYIGSRPDPTPVQQVGDTVSYYDDISDSKGKVIGHAIGYVVAVHRVGPDHLLTEYHETVDLTDVGRFYTTGYMDRGAMITGNTVHLQAFGASGQFAGKSGFREWALKKPIPKPLTNAEPTLMNLSLCG